MKKLLIASAFINVLFLIAALALAVKFLMPDPAPTKDWKYDLRTSLFEVLPDDTAEIVFIGNSITERCELSELFNNPRIKNRGIGSDMTTGVLARLPEITRSHPDMIFIEIGINDLSKGFTTPNIINNYTAILNRIQGDTPDTKVFIQSVLPVAASNPISNDSIQVLNSLLKGLSDTSAVYIDLYSSFVSGGQMNPAYTLDGVHLNGQGYLLMRELLLPYL
jgi:lysophospholipase L1-like esterase